MPRTAHPFSIFIAVLLLISSINCVAAFPVTVTDYYGNVTIHEQPQRIVSIMPSNTEILYAVGAGGQVVGVTDYCNYPPEAQNIARIGGYVTLDHEKILDLEPDLVLAYEANGDEAISSLKKLGLKVVTLESVDMGSIRDNINTVGIITGHEEEANLIVSDMDRRTQKIISKTQGLDAADKPRVLFIVSFDPMYAAGAGSFPDDMIKIAGGSNIVEADYWPVISLEEVVDKNPQIIICTGMGEKGIRFRDQILNNSILAATDAVQQQKVYPILSPNIVERPGPRVILGLEEIYSYIHPELQEEGSAAANDTSASLAEPESKASPQAPGFGALASILMVLCACLIRRA